MPTPKEACTRVHDSQSEPGESAAVVSPEASGCSPGVGDMTFEELREQAGRAELVALKVRTFFHALSSPTGQVAARLTKSWNVFVAL
eukprot:scaffold112317_cov22-Prasinocladus_malaysianus.AAC.1